MDLELKTFAGEPLRIPDDANGKWSIIEFANADATPHLQRYGTFIEERPFDDVQLITAVVADDVDAALAAYEKRQEEQAKRKRASDAFQTLVVPGGFDHPIIQQLGILSTDNRPNIVMVRPDGTIATFLSGLTMTSQSGNVMQNLLQWHDKSAVEAALAQGNIDEAKRVAFAHAPVEQVPPTDAPKNWKPKQISSTHLWARAKVYLAMGDHEAALADAEEAYLAINSKAGYLAMRTDDLDEIEKLKAAIVNAAEGAESDK